MPADGGRLLVVDDDHLNRVILAKGLEQLGYEVAVAESGQQSLRMLRGGQTCDVILADIVMPEMDGYDLLRFLKSNPATAAIPVVMMSANDDDAGIARCLELGADDYLAKPLNAVLWQARLRSVLAKHRLREVEKTYLRMLEEEEAKADRLLLNVLPREIADRLKNEWTLIADQFDDVTVLFADLVGFTELAAVQEPATTVSLLNEVFSRFDGLVEKHGLEKIKTIGDAYMAVGGLPVPVPDHTAAAVSMAVEMLDAVHDLDLGAPLDLRIGIHRGPVVAGVIGTAKFSYDLWGDTVNVASRMESHGTPGRIQVTAAVRDELEGRFAFESRGTITVKGRGEMPAWFVTTGGSGA